MRYLFVILFYCSAFVLFGQGKIAYRDVDTVLDSSLRIIDYEKEETKPKAAIYINGKYYHGSVFHSITAVLDLQKIRSFNIVKEDTVINGILYHEKIHITLDSVFEIKVKEDIVTSDCGSYIIDENAILQIAYGKIKSPQIAFVEILTKTEKILKNEIQSILEDDEKNIYSYEISFYYNFLLHHERGFRTRGYNRQEIRDNIL
jgi:hypothetical protein